MNSISVSKVAPVAAIVAALALSLAFVSPASAANFSNVVFENSQTTIQGTGSATVQATFHIVVPVGEVVEQIQTDVVGDNLAPVCTSVGQDLGLQEGTYDVTLPIKLPPNTGTYTVNVQGSGIFGGLRAIDCSANVVGSAGFGSAVRVVSSSTSSTTVGGSDVPSWLAALIAALKPAPAPTTPATSAACSNIAAKLVGAQPGVTNSANVKLQGFLLSEGASIPALAAGASFGFYGPQTASAVAWYKMTNSCVN